MGEELESEVKKKNWFYVISPCVIAAGFSVYAIIDSWLSMKSSGGWSFIGIIMFVPILLAIVLIDVFIKSLLKKNIFYLWLIEITLIVILFYFGLNRFL